VGAASALGASAALGPEVLAGASAYIAGAESARAITGALERGGMDSNAAEAVGGISGGAVGGVTAAATGAAATVGGAMLFGAEVGDAVGIVGGPVGMAVGAGLGATIGAAIGGVGYLFSHIGGHQDSQPTAQQRQEAQRVQAMRARTAQYRGEYATYQQQHTVQEWHMPGFPNVSVRGQDAPISVRGHDTP
jgi:hypothetical protein